VGRAMTIPIVRAHHEPRPVSQVGPGATMGHTTVTCPYCNSLSSVIVGANFERDETFSGQRWSTCLTSCCSRWVEVAPPAAAQGSLLDVWGDL
jgi:hypothetical protein